MSRKSRVLIVDDEDDLVWSLTARLGRTLPHADVEGVSDSLQSLELIRQHAYDVIVADLKMPNVSGVELILEARRMGGSSRFVVMTAYPPWGGTGPSFGLVRYVEKPFEWRTMSSAVAELLEAGPGEARRIPVGDVVQLLMLSNATGELRAAATMSGSIWLDRGRVVHADTMISSGVLALRALLARDQSQLSFVPDGRPDRRSFGEDGLDATSSLIRRAMVRDGQVQTSTIRGNHMANVSVQATLEKLRAVDGYIGSALVDSDSGMALGIDGGGGALNLEVAAAGNTEVVRAKRKAMKSLNLNDEIDDILVTLGKQYHLIRPVRGRPAVFIYLAIDRARANLAMARMTLNDAEKNLSL